MGLLVPLKNPYPSEGQGFLMGKGGVELWTPAGTPLLITKNKTPTKKGLMFSYDDISPMGELSLKWFKDASGFAKPIQ